MLATAHTFTLDGIAARRVRVEVDVHRGLPTFSIVGLPDAAVREARERVRAAVVNTGFEFPLSRITVNLAPASLRKAGPGLDLAIAAGLLSASGQLDWAGVSRACLAGELALDGRVRPIPGTLAMAESARRSGADQFVVPAQNDAEAALVPGLDVVGIESLEQIHAIAAGEHPAGPATPLQLRPGADPGGPDLADLRGQPHLRRGLEVAAAGGHNILMVGPPGVGKSLAARRLPSILPPLSTPEVIEAARIASACGRLDPDRLGERPFRAPHHTISTAGLVGGGVPPRPGEVTLAHRGVLFLDELCEFHRDGLEALRSPLEDGKVAITRAGGRIEMPCRFMLVAATNPCPCGRGDESPECACTASSIQRYQSRISGALADRVEIVISMSRPRSGEMGAAAGEDSAAVRERTIAARERQEARLGEGRCNAEMTPSEARDLNIDSEAGRLLELAFDRDRMSGRAHDRILRVARTVADLAGRDEIGGEELAAALALRRREQL